MWISFAIVINIIYSIISINAESNSYFDVGGRDYYQFIFDLVAIIPVFFYSGIKRIKSKVWQSFNYLYYPLHCFIIYVIFLTVKNVFSNRQAFTDCF